MTYPVSACVFIKNNYQGAFCLWESMASLLPFVSEFLVMDLGSTDGTLETLLDLEEHNPKIMVLQKDDFPKKDASVFADLANELIAKCQYDNVLYYQADEIWHQRLLHQMELRFQRGEFDLSFWRIQFRDNFQKIKWFPHIVHRVGPKDNFNFVGDGMNSDRYMSAKLCYEQYNGGWFTRWGSEFDFNGNAKAGDMKEDTPYKIPVYEMITDVSLVGGFRDNIPFRRSSHAPLWHEQPTIENIPANAWHVQAINNPDWIKKESPFDLPHILKGLVGETTYYLRPELLEALRRNETRALLGI